MHWYICGYLMLLLIVIQDIATYRQQTHATENAL